MTAQPHPLRCETCAHFQTSGKGMSPDCDQISHWLTEGDRKLIIEVGCASHSASSQQRIEQVIKELEKLANEEERLKKESKTNEPWMGHAYANSAYLKAITLLRGEQHE